MPIFTYFNSPPPESLASQIQQLVVDNVTDISSIAIAPSNPLYRLYQYGVGYEVHLYLQAMAGANERRVELIVATDRDAPETLTGFVLYLREQDDAQACVVVFMAVLASHRRQGIGRALLEQVMQRYPAVELDCFVSKVPCFEAMGLRALAARGPQILMSTRHQPGHGHVARVDVAPIYQSLEVRQIHTYLLNQHGKRAMVDAEKKRDRHLDQLTRQAQAYIPYP